MTINSCPNRRAQKKFLSRMYKTEMIVGTYNIFPDFSKNYYDSLFAASNINILQSNHHSTQSSTSIIGRSDQGSTRSNPCSFITCVTYVCDAQGERCTLYRLQTVLADWLGHTLKASRISPCHLQTNPIMMINGHLAVVHGDFY